jgi:ArsR family transcriptional regulator
MKSEDVVLALGALAQESRLAIFRLLVKRGPDGYSPSDLVEKLEIPAPTLSFHLRELQRAGLIAARRGSLSLLQRQFRADAGLDQFSHREVLQSLRY